MLKKKQEFPSVIPKLVLL